MNTLTNHDYSLLLALSRYMQRNPLYVVATLHHYESANDLVFTVNVSSDSDTDRTLFAASYQLKSDTYGASRIGDTLKPFFVEALARTFNAGYMRAHIMTDLFTYLRKGDRLQTHIDGSHPVVMHDLSELTFVHGDTAVCITADSVRIEDVMHTHEQLTTLSQ